MSTLKLKTLLAVAAIAASAGVGHSFDPRYSKRRDLQREAQAKAQAKRKRVREEIRARKATKGGV